MYTLDGGEEEYVETTQANGSYSAKVSNTTGLTVAVQFNVTVNPAAANYVEHVSVNLASTHLNIEVGVNSQNGPEGITYSDAATKGRPVNVAFTSGSWSLSFTDNASPTEVANYTSSLMSGPDGVFTSGKSGSTPA